MAEEKLEEQGTIGQELEVASSDHVPATTRKVELDLDDAPFLQAEEKASAPANIPEELPDADKDADQKGKRKKKLIIFGGAGAALLLLCGVGAWFFFGGSPPPPPVAVSRPEVVVVPTPPAEPGQTEIVREFAPFIVPTVDSSGQTHFLVCKFSAISSDANVNQEVQQQLVPLRDAIYYYLRSKDNAFLLDAKNGDRIRQDLLSVFNDYLTRGKLDDIVFESYLNH